MLGGLQQGQRYRPILEEFNDRYEVQRLLDRVEEYASHCLWGLRALGYSAVLSPVVLSKSQAYTTRPLYLDIVFDCEILFDKDDFMKTKLECLKGRLREYGAERRFIGKKWVVVLKKDLKFGRW